LFSRHPKSPSAWQHVRWCYIQRLSLRDDSSEAGKYSTWDRRGNYILPAELETEREICRRSAERYPKNYYAWMHRLWLLSQMNCMQVTRAHFNLYFMAV
jgi:protein prenyltransferase alpha subunit repeat containing protein 1